MSESKQEIVVTGVNGFAGEHLARHLQELNYAVRGVGREQCPGENVGPYLDYYQSADLLKSGDTQKIVFKNAAAIIHLAGLASVAESFEKPELYKTGNAEMTNNLFESATEQGFSGRIVVISTGALYDPSQPMPLNESSVTTQGSPYAVGKIRAEEVIKKYASEGLDTIIVRPFNHIGPGQGNGFLVADLYDQLLKASASGESSILVGNLATRRDYTDVRDIVKAYAKLATAESLDHDTYNIASGASLSGFEILQYLKGALNLTDIDPIVDPSKVRPTDAMDIIGDASRLSGELGWSPLSNPEKAIEDFVARKKDLVLS